jgi:hypothetical protein
MTKNDLKVGYVVETKEGNLYMVMETQSGKIFVRNEGFNWLSSYKDDLINQELSEFDVTRIYGFSYLPMESFKISKNNRPLLWKRKEYKEMTLAEIEKALGYKVKIVEE